jgi:hypothetical protein
MQVMNIFEPGIYFFRDGTSAYGFYKTKPLWAQDECLRRDDEQVFVANERPFWKLGHMWVYEAIYIPSSWLRGRHLHH